uniref:B9 domain-containing protein 1 n=1 Tax=Nyctotherus ovalis TaxID=70075 RepID=A6MI54_NYCOV|nr:B9 protein [Nyctotherus ovalis]
MSRQEDFDFEEDKELLNEPDKNSPMSPPKQELNSSVRGGSHADSEHGSKKQDKVLSGPSDHSCFYVGISGFISYAEFPFLNGIRCKFFINTGKDWEILDGIDAGSTQHAFKPDYGSSRRIVWNFPFELIYKSVNPHGWPQMMITCSGRDFLGRENNYAFGSVFVPTMAGKHERYMRMFSPVSSSWLTRFVAWTTANFADYIDAPKTISETEGREVTRVKAEGHIKISFQVTLSNFEKYGYY